MWSFLNLEWKKKLLVMLTFGHLALQHRGQEQTGIASTDGKNIFSYKHSGLVSQVYTAKIIKN